MSELSPEERRRIYEEEKARVDAEDQARAEARAQIEAERAAKCESAAASTSSSTPKPRTSLLTWLVVAMLFVGAGVAAYPYLNPPDPRLKGHRPDEHLTSDVNRSYTYAEWIEEHPDVPVDQAVLHIVKGNSARIRELEAYITLTEFSKVPMGCKYSEVVKYWGRPGTQTAKNRMAGYTTEIYEWGNPDPGGTVVLMFQDGRLIQKNQAGLID